MRETKYHAYLDSEERTILLHSLVELKNQLIQQGRYTDCVDELIVKVINAPVKKLKVLVQEVVMYDKDFAQLVKIAVEKLKEDTVYKMLIHSEDYQKESDVRDKAERNYEQLDLTIEQRKVCNVFLDYRDRQSLEYSDYSYLAGLYDAFRIMAVIFPDRWDMDQIQKALSLIEN